MATTPTSPPPAVSRTLLEIRDPRVLATADASLVLSCLMLLLSVAQFHKRRTYFYAGIVSSAIPLVVADVWTLLAADELVSTNSYLVVRILCPLFSTSQVCGLSIIRFHILSSTDQIRWFTRRMSNILLTVVYGEMILSTLILTISYIQQSKQQFFTSHPYRTPVIMGHMALTSILDFVLAVSTFRVVWSIRANALKRRSVTAGGGIASSSPSDGEGGGTFEQGITSAPPPTPSIEYGRSGDIPSSSTLALMPGSKHDAVPMSTASLSSSQFLHPVKHGIGPHTSHSGTGVGFLPDRPLRISTQSAIPQNIDNAPTSAKVSPNAHQHPQSGGAHAQFAIATGLIKLSKSMHSLGSIASFTSTTTRSAVRSVKHKQKAARLRRVTGQLLLALTAMMIGVVGGLGTFGLSSGNMFGDNIAGLFIRIYLLPATICWTLLVELTKATRM
ncbi:hypothetical protein BCR44DRAFT_53688 [Catenaria anguillulae PL171]|uniref:Uncharacterized protein n=1 Tax=Catenaria anguillulae PL171 TaxID=765915 RepID=A0A1Y2HKG0_9FUNG|nr:hypothetical protein BCR44DRAFT_53688 [Catenaria anguillulae PL171]